MPQDVGEAKDHVEEKFWSLLASRHPLTCWWWGSPHPEKLNLLPEWSAPAFVREAQEWRRLAQETVNVNDDEVQHWGRYARWAAVRLSSGSYQDGADPLVLANALWHVVELLDATREFYPRDKLLNSLSEWLNGIAGVTAADHWRKIRVQSESKRLLEQLRRVQPPVDGDLSMFMEKRQRTIEAVEQYVLRVIHADKMDGEPIAWALSAQMFVDEWRAMRHHMSQEPLVTIEYPDLGPHVLHPELEYAPAIQEVVVPSMEQWWVRPASQQTLIYHGAHRDLSLPLALILALWHQRSAMGPMTWALTPPPHVEGGLMALAHQLESLWPTWEPVKSRVLAQWNQRRRALAMVDAWLWLEDCDPDEALKWLCRFVPKPQAVVVIPWMKTHPGHYVLAHQVFTALSTVEPTPSWNHWVFRKGPMMPPALFL